MEISIGHAIKVYLRGARLCIIEEMQLVIADGHVGDELAVEGIVGHFRLTVCGYSLLYAQACGIILEFDRLQRLGMVNPCVRGNSAVQSGIERLQFVAGKTIVIVFGNNILFRCKIIAKCRCLNEKIYYGTKNGDELFSARPLMP